MVAFNSGSVPEIITDGVSGFIVEDEAGAVAAVGRLSRLDRAGVRAEFENRFTAKRMASDYLDVYRSLGAAKRPPLRAIG